MSESNLYRIEDFISELTSVTFSDVLVNINEEYRGVFQVNSAFEEPIKVPFATKINQIVKVATQYNKNSDVQSLCLSSYLFTWNYNNKEHLTPLILFPLQHKVNKIKKEFDFSFDQDLFFFNPFLLNILKKDFNLDFSFNLESNFRENLELFLTVLKENQFNFELKNLSLIGNFHHHRYEVVKDLEELISLNNNNYLVNTLLGNPENENLTQLNLTSKNCFATDTDQAEIFKHLENTNLVIQGPPGTGKSHVLANLISKLLIRDGKQLIVSEKKTALDVLVNKLKEFKLHNFTFVFHSQAKNGDFIKHLKSTWDFLENLEQKEERNILLSVQYKQQIQLVFDKLNQSNYFPGKNLSELQELSKLKSAQDLTYISTLPTFEEWLKIKENVAIIYNSLPNCGLLSSIHHGIFKNIENFDKVLSDLYSDFKILNKIFQVKTLLDLDKIFKKTIRIQLFDNEANKKYFSLFNSKSNLKKFNKLKQEYLSETLKLELTIKEILIWKVIPTLSEIESWELALKNGNWFKKRKINHEISSKLSHSTIDSSVALKNIKNYLNQLEKCTKIEIEFFEIGIEKPDIELSLVSYVLNQFSAFSSNELNEISSLSFDDKQHLRDFRELIDKTLKNIKAYFAFSLSADILCELGEIEREISTIIKLKEVLISIPSSVLSNLKSANNSEEFELLILKANWTKFSSMFPELSSFNGEKLKNQIDTIISIEKEEQNSFANEICFKKKQTFLEYQALLIRQTAKLSEEEKQIKKVLKIGKAILVKEFSKSKQHRSVRELLATEAQLWIDLLCPIHLSTPTMVSKNYPLSQNLFEFVIFDEASQMVLPKAISCVQRASRLLVAGDSQQMAPSSFFAGKISSVDLLHQTTFYLPNIGLKHHYRSKYSELIQFSNKHFYKDELIVYPSPAKNEYPISFHYVEKGIFENRQNAIEAKIVARFIEKNIESNKTIGVVAFSEQQLICIWNNIHVKYHPILEEKIKNNQLFFKSLEQVQGEECDHLIISLAYGKDVSGKFHLRFGPLNQQNGAKRLNVLFTRAKEKIDFFSSVLSQDFSLSTNESINLLRQYIQIIETQKNDFQENKIKENKLIFPFNLSPEIEGNVLKITEVNKKINNAEELKTFQNVMESRSWRIEYIL